MQNEQKAVFDIFTLPGKTAIVTGGSGGLGTAMTVALAEAGADIVSLQLPNDPLGDSLKESIESLQRRFSVFECNLADPKSIRETFVSIWAAGIVPDILLNCAGTNRRGKVEDISDEDIDLAFVGTQPTRKDYPHCLDGIFIARTNVSIYAITKAGVRHMTKALSNEWAGQGIQCNCICPGFMKTNLTKPLWSDPDFYKKSMERTPAGRWGLPGDLIGAALLLASSASDYITGESIVVDDGVIGQ